MYQRRQENDQKKHRDNGPPQDQGRQGRASPPPIDYRGREVEAAPEHVREMATYGTSGSTGELPFRAELEASFGRSFKDLPVHRGTPEAQEACESMDAEAYVSGGQLVFRDADPDKELVAHELAHVVQQGRGVSLPGGVGRAGDAYEQQADAVAQAVIQGESVEGLLGRSDDDASTSSTGRGAVQKQAVQMDRGSKRRKQKRRRHQKKKSREGNAPRRRRRGGRKRRRGGRKKMSTSRSKSTDTGAPKEDSQAQPPQEVKATPKRRKQVSAKVVNGERVKQVDAGTATEKKNAERTLTSKRKGTVKMTPQMVVELQKDINDNTLKPMCRDLKGWFKESLGCSAPNEVGCKVTFQLGDVETAEEEKKYADDGKGEVARGKTYQKDEEAAAGAAKVSAKIEGSVGWKWSVSKIGQSLGASKGWNKWTIPVSLGGENVEAYLTADADFFLGVKAEASASVSASHDALSGVVDKLVTAFKFNARKAAAKEGDKQVKALEKEKEKKSDKGLPKYDGQTRREGDPDNPSKSSLAISGGVAGKVFAGAEVTGKVEGGLKWRKHYKDYTRKLEEVFDLISDLTPPLKAFKPIYKFLSAKTEIDDYLAAIIFGKSTQPVDVLKATMAVALQVGAGAEGAASLTWSGGKFTTELAATATLGLGGGVSTNIEGDVIEAARLALAVSAGVWSDLKSSVGDGLESIGGWIGEKLEEKLNGIPLYDWFTKDDKAIAFIEENEDILEFLDASKRAKLVNDILDPAVFNDSEKAILTVLRVSKDKGDLDQVLARIDIAEMLSDVDFGEYDKLLKLIGGGQLTFFTFLTTLRYPYGWAEPVDDSRVRSYYAETSNRNWSMDHSDVIVSKHSLWLPGCEHAGKGSYTVTHTHLKEVVEAAHKGCVARSSLYVGYKDPETAIKYRGPRGSALYVRKRRREKFTWGKS